MVGQTIEKLRLALKKITAVEGPLRINFLEVNLTRLDGPTSVRFFKGQRNES